MVAIVWGCKKEVKLSSTKLVTGQIFTEGLRVDGHEFDSLVIENCTFEGKPLTISNADYVIVRNCTFHDIDKLGVWVGVYGEAKNVLIDNCSFENIGGNGIDSHENAPNGTITNCIFKNTALSDIDAAMGQPHHAIYWKGKNVRITQCSFIGGEQEFGNAISVRSSGLISGNRVQGFPKNAITYFSDHPGEDSLIIENNFLWNNTYSISLTTNGNEAYFNKNIVIRFNSLIQSENYSIYISNEFKNLTNVFIYGNIIVNPTDEYFKKFDDYAQFSLNLKSNDDIGFVDMSNGDLHLKNSSIGNGYCDSLTFFPLTDIDGETRIQMNLDAGADEIN